VFSFIPYTKQATLEVGAYTLEEVLEWLNYTTVHVCSLQTSKSTKPIQSFCPQLISILVLGYNVVHRLHPDMVDTPVCRGVPCQL